MPKPTFVLTIPDVWLDPEDLQRWSVQATPSSPPVEMSFLEVLLATVRTMQVKTAEDAERSLALLLSIKQAVAEKHKALQFEEADYHWMLDNIKENAVRIWNGPSAAKFLRQLKLAERHEAAKPNAEGSTAKEKS